MTNGQDMADAMWNDIPNEKKKVDFNDDISDINYKYEKSENKMIITYICIIIID